jgi:hypothetical protein
MITLRYSSRASQWINTVWLAVNGALALAAAGAVMVALQLRREGRVP